MESSAKLLEDSLLVIWNDRDAQRRLLKMKEVYATDIRFYESNESSAFIGHKAINELITKPQSQWPTDFLFQLTSPSRVNHQVQYISWDLGVPSQTPALSGMDIAIIQDDKILSLHLFLNTQATK